MSSGRFRLLFAFVLVALSAGASAEDAFAPVRAHLNRAVEQGDVAGGAVLVWHDGGVVFATGFGYADRATHRPFEIDTPVVVASISKPLLGTALYRVAQDKALALDAPVTDYLPVFNGRALASGQPLERPPTVTELLTHTAGFRPDDANGGRIWFQAWTRNLPLEEVVDRIAADIPFASQPGQRKAYSGIGTEVAARVGEVVTGRPRNEMLRAYLCEPLGMKGTHYRDKAALVQIDRPMPTRYYRSKESDKLAPSRPREVPDTNRYSSSGGTIISTAPDLLRWLLMIRNAGVHEGNAYLSRESTSAMLRAHPVGNRADGGLAILRKNQAGKPVVFGHTGSSGTSVWIDLETDTIAIMLTQTKGSDIRAFRQELDKRIAQAVAD